MATAGQAPNNPLLSVAVDGLAFISGRGDFTVTLAEIPADTPGVGDKYYLTGVEGTGTSSNVRGIPVGYLNRGHVPISQAGPVLTFATLRTLAAATGTGGGARMQLQKKDPDVPVEATDLGKTLKKNFAGWVFPNGGKSLIGSNLRIIIRKQEGEKTSPHEQIIAAIKKAKAEKSGPNSRAGIELLYAGLRDIRSEYSLIQPLYASVSGHDFQPAVYYVENYLCPTARFWSVLLECQGIVIDKSKYITGADAADNFDLFAFAKGRPEDGVVTASLMQSHTILHLSSADAGLKFKDRQAAKLALDTRERSVLTIVATIATIR